MVSELANDLEFKVVYVSSANHEDDQLLESVMVGPVPVGISKFVLDVPGPNPSLIPAQDIVGLTVVLLQCAYLTKEFIRVGYYCNNDYTDEVMRLDPPETPQVQLLQRSILADKPRVTRYPIPW